MDTVVDPPTSLSTESLSDKPEETVSSIQTPAETTTLTSEDVEHLPQQVDEQASTVEEQYVDS